MNRLLTTALMIASIIICIPLPATEGLMIFGKMETESVSGIGHKDVGHNGFLSRLTLSMEGGQESVQFRGEGGFESSWGILDRETIIADSGLSISQQEIQETASFGEYLFIDQAWASTRTGPLIIRGGFIPIAWGSAYLYNPTLKVSEPLFPGEELERTHGVPGMAMDLALPKSITIEGYLLAKPRTGQAMKSMDSISTANFPFGSRLTFRTENIDSAVSFFRELPSAHENPRYWLGAEASVLTGPVLWYGEGSATIKNPMETAECSFGVSSELPWLVATLRAEYLYFANGSDTDTYDISLVLIGQKVLLAQQYLFISIEKEDPDTAAWMFSAGVLVNLVDTSSLILLKAEWKPLTEASFSIFTRFFSASFDSTNTGEFGGSHTLAPGITFRPYRSLIGLSATWNF